MIPFIILLSAIFVGLVLYVFPLVQVCGDSMSPNLNDGDIILTCRLFDLISGGVYVFKSPVDEKYVIKRLSSISATGKLFFEGDNSEYSYDSRMYGYISKDKVVSRYILTIYKKGVVKNDNK